MACHKYRVSGDIYALLDSRDTTHITVIQGAAEIVPIFAGVEVQGLGWMFSRVYYTSKMGVVGVGAQRVSSLQNLVLVLNRACFLIWA